VWAFYVFKQYIAVCLLICLPVLITGSLVVVFFHYRKKRLRRKEETAPGSPGSPVSQVEISPYLTDREYNNLFKNFKKQLAGNRAKYVALKHDLDQSEAGNGSDNHLSTENSSYMENLEEKISRYERQIADLQDKIDVLETAFPAGDEAHFLRQIIGERDKEIEGLKKQMPLSIENGEAGSDSYPNNVKDEAGEVEGLKQELGQLQEENTSLKNHINEKEYLGDMLEENKLHINFLQGQLEQRIKAQKQLEKNLSELSQELRNKQAHYEEIIRKNNLEIEEARQKSEEIENLRKKFQEKESYDLQLNDTLQQKQSHIAELQTMINSLTENNNFLTASASNSQGITDKLKEQLVVEKQKNGILEDQLKQIKDILHRVYEDIGQFVERSETVVNEQGIVKQMF
jgi:DNA repair exonuclease SbcCD ATPase subunit